MNMYDNIPIALQAYVERYILPRYSNFDPAHRQPHIRAVIDESLHLAALNHANPFLAYTIAAYHDLGLVEGRERHHLVSAQILLADTTLRNWFSPQQIALMAQAIEDHRASSSHEPRSLYGKIVAEADRQIEPTDIVRRTIQYGLAHYSQLPLEGHWQRALDHLHEKYGRQGYLKLWFPQSHNATGLENLRLLIDDTPRLRHLFLRLYNLETSTVTPATKDDLDGIMQLIENSRQIMRRSGNQSQWVNGYPSPQTILDDIARKQYYIIRQHSRLVGSFAFIRGEEPTYKEIHGGSWSDPDQPYATIHRLASAPSVSGIGNLCLDWCKQQISHLRADTHEDNPIVRHILEHNGFTYRGTIHLADGSPRRAYQWSSSDEQNPA